MTRHVRQLHWSYNYIGLPWASSGSSRSGVSCLGLRNLVFREVLHIDLPDYGCTVDAYEGDEIASLLVAGKDDRPWVEIAPSEAGELDCVTFRLRGLDSHLGIIVGRSTMLHIQHGYTSNIERIDTDVWQSLQPKFYRHVPWTARDIVSLPNSPIVLPTLEKVDATVTVPPGTSLLQAVHLCFPHIPESAHETIRITVGTDVVPQEYWGQVRPKRWDVVIIRVVQGISGFLRIMLIIGLLIGAAAISGGALGALAPTAGMFAGWLGAGTLSAHLLGAVVGIGGSLLINALIPTAKPKDNPWDKIPVYNISGFQNSLNADGVVPSVLGFTRWSPPFAALPFNFTYFLFRYATTIFLIGYGEVEISDIMIGLTPLESYIGVQTRISTGTDIQNAFDIYTSQVIEDSDNPLDVPASIGLQRRITAVNATAFEVEFYFGSGLIAYDQNGNQQVMGVLFAINYRKLGDTTWVLGQQNVFGIQTRSFWTAFRYELPTRGQYEVQVVRLTPDLDDIQFGGALRYVSKSTWSALRSFRPEAPLNYTKPMALIAMHIQASAQLGGTIQGVSCMCKRVCLDWDATSSTWIRRATQNPASLFRYVLQGPENAFPKTDDEIDLLDLQDWHVHCVAHSLTYNAVHQSDESQQNILEAVAAAGHAMPHDRGDKYSVIVDKERTLFTAHITPGNTAKFIHTNPKVIFPDAFFVSFNDETNYYNPSKRVIPWPGHTGDIAVTQELGLPGVTNPTQVWKDARRRQYEAEARQDSYTVEMDMENLNCARGDAVKVSHFVLNKRQMGGYVQSVSPDHTKVSFDSLVTLESGLTYQARFRHNDGTTFTGVVTNDGPVTKSWVTISSYSSGFAVVGDLIAIGEASVAEEELIIKAIQPGENFSASLSMIAHAPDLDDLVDADTVPTWDGIIGNQVDFGAAVAPGVPLITQILSGSGAAYLASSSNPYPIVVFVSPNAADVPFSGSLTVRYRINGTSTWTTGSAFLPGNQNYNIPGFANGDVVEIQAKATRSSLDSAWTGSIVVTNGSNVAPYWVPAAFQLADLYIDFLQPVLGGGDYGMAWMQGLNREANIRDIATLNGSASYNSDGLATNGSAGNYLSFSDRTWLTVSQPGTIWVHYRPDTITGTQGLLDLANVSHAQLLLDPGPKSRLIDTSAATLYTPSGSSLTAGTLHTMALTWDSTHAGAARDATAQTRATFGTAALNVPNSVLMASLGGPANPFNGRIRRMAYFKALFSDSQLGGLG